MRAQSLGHLPHLSVQSHVKVAKMMVSSVAVALAGARPGPREHPLEEQKWAQSTLLVIWESSNDRNHLLASLRNIEELSDQFMVYPMPTRL